MLAETGTDPPIIFDELLLGRVADITSAAYSYRSSSVSVVLSVSILVTSVYCEKTAD